MGLEGPVKRGTGSDSRAMTAALSLEDVGGPWPPTRARLNDGAGEHPGLAL